MKKFLIPLLAVFIIIGCSSDDDAVVATDNDPDIDTPDAPVGQAIIRISDVDAIADEVTLTNLGNASTDIGDYFLCLGPGTYAQVSGLTSEATTLAPNETITVSYDVNPTADGLGVFATNTFDSSDPTVLLDYVQWGDVNQPRVDQAVTAGRWDSADNFVGDGSPYAFTGGATDVGSTFWVGTATSSIVRIFQVDTDTDEVTLFNFGNASVDVGSYFLCLGPGTYAQISNIATGSTTIAPDGMITIPYDMNPANDGLAVFSTNTFGSSDPSILLDYVQWGAESQARSDQAVAAGRWDNVANFVAIGSPYNFTGGAQDVGVTFW